MSKVMVELVAEQLMAITRNDLKESYDSLKKDLEDSYKSSYTPMFNTDIKEDRKHIRKLMKSFEIVLEYYGLGVENGVV